MVDPSLVTVTITIHLIFLIHAPELRGDLKNEYMQIKNRKKGLSRWKPSVIATN